MDLVNASYERDEWSECVWLEFLLDEELPWVLEVTVDSDEEYAKKFEKGGSLSDRWAGDLNSRVLYIGPTGGPDLKGTFAYIWSKVLGHGRVRDLGEFLGGE